MYTPSRPDTQAPLSPENIAFLGGLGIDPAATMRRARDLIINHGLAKYTRLEEGG